jgi:hypothetical protein
MGGPFDGASDLDHVDLLSGAPCGRRRLRSLLLPHKAGLMRTAGPGVNANVDSKIARSGLIVARFYSRAVPRRKTTEVKSLEPWDHCNHLDLHQIGRIGETRYLQQGARGKRRLVRKI